MEMVCANCGTDLCTAKPFEMTIGDYATLTSQNGGQIRCIITNVTCEMPLTEYVSLPTGNIVPRTLREGKRTYTLEEV